MSEFDNFYWKHNDCLNKDTSLAHSFGEKVWNHQQAKIDSLTLEIAEMKSRLNDNYTSGQTSMYLTQQSKIDLLEVQLKGVEERAKLTLDHKNRMVDELQARVDKAMKYVSESPLKDVSRRAMINFVDILKGRNND